MDRIASPWGTPTPVARGGAWPARVDQRLADGVEPADVERWAPTASLLHSNGDAMDIAVRDGRIVGVRGREGDRVNRGGLAEGPVRLAGQRVARPPDDAAGRRPPRLVGRGDGRGRRALPGGAG